MPFKPTDHLEKRSAKGPFEVEMDDGSVYTLPNPKKLHYKQLEQMDDRNPGSVMHVLLGEKFREFVDHEEVSGEWLEAAFTAWREHYDLPAPGESTASSR